MILTFAGILGAIITGLGDFVHFMNRDINYYIYGAEGYIGLTITIGAIFQMCSSRFLS